MLLKCKLVLFYFILSILAKFCLWPCFLFDVGAVAAHGMEMTGVLRWSVTGASATSI